MHEIINWDDLRVLLVIDKRGSFLKAGSDLNMAASTISRRISQMEEHLGFTVVERSADGCNLTSRGAALTKIAASFDKEVEQELTSSTKINSGLIKLNSVNGFSSFLVEVIREFTNLYPECTIDWSITDNALDIHSNEADVGIRTEHLGEHSLIYRKVADIEFGFYCSSTYKSTLENKVHPSDVRYISLLPPLSNEYHMIKAREAGFVRHNLRVSSTTSLIDLVRQGLGVAAIPVVFSDNLERVFPEITLPKLAAYCTTRPQSLKQPQVRAFVDMIYQKAEEYK